MRGTQTLLRELSIGATPAGCAPAILAVTAGCLIAGLVAVAGWRISGDPIWIRLFFQVPGALVMVWLAMVQLWLSAAAVRQFAAGELMRSAWVLVSISAAANLLGTIAVQMLAAGSSLNLLQHWTVDGRAAGQVLGGPVRFALLAGALGLALRAYKQARFLGSLRLSDWVLLALFAAFQARGVADVAAAWRSGKIFGWLEIANWPTDPLLLLLLAEGLLLRRSVEQMGAGWIGRCWSAFSLGVLLTALGDVGGWAEAYGRLRYPWTAIVWFVWLPAAASLAAAPAYQLQAVHRASGTVS